MRGAMLQLMVAVGVVLVLVFKVLAGVLRLGFFLVGGVALLGAIGGALVWAFTGKTAGLIHGAEAVGAYLLVYVLVAAAAEWLPKKLAQWRQRIEQEQMAAAMPEDARFSDEINGVWREIR